MIAHAKFQSSSGPLQAINNLIWVHNMMSAGELIPQCWSAKTCLLVAFDSMGAIFTKYIAMSSKIWIPNIVADKYLVYLRKKTAI